MYNVHISIIFFKKNYVQTISFTNKQRRIKYSFGILSENGEIS